MSLPTGKDKAMQRATIHYTKEGTYLVFYSKEERDKFLDSIPTNVLFATQIDFPKGKSIEHMNGNPALLFPNWKG